MKSFDQSHEKTIQDLLKGPEFRYLGDQRILKDALFVVQILQITDAVRHVVNIFHLFRFHCKIGARAA